jgi:predicted ribosomally synthesized peptide with nif11-like leader
MSIQAALHFLDAARSQVALRDQLEALPYNTTLETVVSLAASLGYQFTVDELRTAFNSDYQMRLLRYNN